MTRGAGAGGAGGVGVGGVGGVGRCCGGGHGDIGNWFVWACVDCVSGNRVKYRQGVAERSNGQAPCGVGLAISRA